ncbi:MAG: hypothetical protein DME26_11325 [Verrucomicrobia bacterium]|nr:MAG: hypothetical protein DME26_11325 [Verrucomicrobiota bacterium]
MTCKTAEGERKLPLEDVASIIITSFSANIHSNLFLEAAKHGVALIICEAFKPVSLVLPARCSRSPLARERNCGRKPLMRSVRTSFRWPNTSRPKTNGWKICERQPLARSLTRNPSVRKCSGRFMVAV